MAHNKVNCAPFLNKAVRWQPDCSAAGAPQEDSEPIRTSPLKAPGAQPKPHCVANLLF